MEKLTKDGFLISVFNYEEKTEWEYQGSTPCLIEFHDDSCPPCHAIETVLEELSEQYRDRVLFFRVDFTEDSVGGVGLGVGLISLCAFPLLGPCGKDEEQEPRKVEDDLPSPNGTNTTKRVRIRGSLASL